MGLCLQLNACDGAVRSLAAEQKPQKASARSQVDDTGGSGQADKIRQHHGIRAQGEPPPRCKGEAAPK